MEAQIAYIKDISATDIVTVNSMIFINCYLYVTFTRCQVMPVLLADDQHKQQTLMLSSLGYLLHRHQKTLQAHKSA